MPPFFTVWRIPEMAELAGNIPYRRAAYPARTTPLGAAVTVDRRRLLQLVLAGVWLFDGLLQLQGVFFVSDFGKTMIAGAADGNPGFLAKPITHSATIIANHPQPTNAAFAAIQIALGLAIAWRPAVRGALVASIVWSLGVWWIGEGFGGVLTGGADPVNGAPGAVIIYALLAVLLWPTDSRPAPFEAARAIGVPIANALWLILWGSLAYFAVAGSNRSEQGLHDLIASEADGEPAWLASLDRFGARAVDHRGLVVSVVLAVVLVLIAVGTYLPARLAQVAVASAIVVSLLLWLIGQDLGQLFTGGATDPNTGPLLVLLALAYWRSTGRNQTRKARVGEAS
jgi:hypothetical protein